MNTSNISIKFVNERFLVWTSITIALGLIAGYGLFVNQTVRNIVERKSLEEKIASVRSRIADRESRFLDLSRAVTLERAYQSGFVNITNVTYVNRTDTPIRLSLNNERADR
jgi:hypothetical protein